MKTFRILGMALVAVMLGFAMSACSDDDEYMKELEKEYSRLIVGKWFNFTPEVSAFMDYKADGSYSVAAYHREKGWIISPAGQYRLEGNQLINVVVNPDGSTKELVTSVEITEDEFICRANSVLPEDQVHYRVKEQFDITGKYTYLNSAVRVVAATGKSELKLPEGITFGGKASISVEALNGERIVEQMKSFFADAMFTPNAKLRHVVDGTVMYKDYALDGNNLSFELNKGHELNATSFPDEDGDRLFIIIPKQEAWVGGLADVIRKENPANVLTDEAIAALEKEFMDTFETFTVVLSLSKTGEYNAAEDVDPYKNYAELIVGKWFNFTPDASVYTEFKTDGTCHVVGYDKHASLGFMETFGAYSLDGNKLTTIYTFTDGSQHEVTRTVEVTKDQFIDKIVSSGSESSGISEKVNYRVKEQFDITGKYSYLNSAVRVVAATGKTELKLPEGITFGGKTSISVEALNGERIVEQMKSFFADAMFTPNAKLRHTVDGTVMYKDYALDGNNLSFELNKGHELNATSFPDEDGDRLFIIIPKQEAWVGGLANVIHMENPANVLTDSVIAALEKEFMDTFETFTVVLSLSKTGEYNATEDVDPYKNYAELIVGKWFNFTPDASVFKIFNTDGTLKVVGYDNETGWMSDDGTWRLDGNKTTEIINKNGSQVEYVREVVVTDDKYTIKAGVEFGEKVHYRVKEQFDITGKYSYLNSAVRVVAATGKSELKLPEGITFGGKTSISIEAMNGERIVEQMKAYFADAMFTPNAKLRHTVDGTVMYKDYALDGNNLSFELNKGHELNATSFPDEDGDRLFIIIPKQEAWVGGLADVIRKENPANVLTDAAIAALEKEFMDTFETFTVVLSLSKTGEYNAAEDVDPYKDYPQLIVGKWFSFTPTASVFLNLSADGIYNMIGYDIGYDNNDGAMGWFTVQGQYELKDNIFTWSFPYTHEVEIEVTEDKMIKRTPNGDKVHYRVQESFDIKGNYSYLNAAVRVVPAEGKTALQLPDGVTFNGQNSISIDAMHGDRIINVMKKFFADATFAADGKLNHTLEGETKVKNYTLNGNNLVFNLYEGSDTYKVNATSFPDEDGDRLFIIIPKQAAWLGGMVDLVEKENEGLKLDAAQIAALEKEFMETFETFTVILSLSKK